MSDYLSVIILGAIQGVAEFLPISSSGHLVVAEELFSRFTGNKLEDPLELTIILHAGTLAAVVVVFWREILRLFTEDRRMIGLIIVGTLPVVVSGLLLEKYFKDVLTSPLVAGCMLIVTGCLLIWAGRQPPGEVTYQQITYKQAWIIGLFQAIAPLPGLSRSGSTISGGMWQRLRPEAAATFSFLLSLPAVGGACTLEGLKLFKQLRDGGASSTPPGQLLVGALVSFVVGVFALLWLLNWLKAGRFKDFAWWCIPLGIAVIIWQLAAS